MVTPRCARRGPKPERQARRLDGGGRGIEGPGAEDRRVAASPHLGFGQRPAGVRDARAPRRRRRPSARSRRAPEPSRPVGSRPPVPGVHPLLLAPAPDPLDRLLCRTCQPQRGARRRSAVEAPAGRTTSRSRSPRCARSGRRRSGRTPAGPPAPRGSSSVTNHAAHIPVYPPPTTTTSAPSSSSSGGSSGIGPASSCHQPRAVCLIAIARSLADEAARASL